MRQVLPTTLPIAIFPDFPAKHAMFAHKLRGAAVKFDAAEVAEAAKALELVVTAGSLKQAENIDPSVWLMLETLADRLASVTDCDLASIPAVTRTHGSRRAGVPATSHDRSWAICTWISYLIPYCPSGIVMA
jgi:hypothetical protein